MKQFVLRACWSESDQENFLVSAESWADVLKKCKESPLKPHHWDNVCEIAGIIK